MATNDTARVDVVGDVFLDRKYPEQAFEHVQTELDASDLLVGNYEAALSNTGEPAKMFPWANFLYSPPEMVEGVDAAGFDVLSLANNQSMNYGPEGLMDTIELLEGRGIAVVGAGESKHDAEQYVSQTVNGIEVGIVAFESTKWDWRASQASPERAGLNQLAISPYFPDPKVAQEDLEKMDRILSTAADETDVLLVMFHWGMAGERQLTIPQKALAHRAVDHGADAVIGAHSHTIQPVEVYESTPIFYSLGNFAFDRPDTWSLDLMPPETITATLTIDETGIRTAGVRPAIHDSGPRDKPKYLAPGTTEYETVTKEVQNLSQRCGTTLTPDDGLLRVPLDETS